MKRRMALKLTALLALGASSLFGYDKSKIVNKNRMRIKDKNNPTKGELKHTPDIKVGKADKKGYVLVEVTVGQEGIIHPSTKDHWIYNIKLYANGNLVGSVDLEPEISRGYLSARVKKEGLKTLKAEASCNLHGTWEHSIRV